jgi:hypothetical protein
MPSQQVPTDFAMDIEYFENDAPSEEVVAALLRDGAAVVRDQVRGNVADAVLLPHCINDQIAVPPRSIFFGAKAISSYTRTTSSIRVSGPTSPPSSQASA